MRNRYPRIEVLDSKRTREKDPLIVQGNTVESWATSRSRDVVVVAIVILLFVIISMTYALKSYGFLILVPKSWKKLRLTPSQVDERIQERTFLFVGGPHRAGTSVVRDALESGSDAVGGFRSDSDSDYGEGMYLQSVYEKTGVGQEYISRRSPRQHQVGMGLFAFNERFHLTESSALVNRESRTKLFNQWGYYWNLQKSVLIEKTPSNMLITRFLQALFRDSRATYFVIITRHPIVNALAQKKTGACGSLGVSDLVAHWAQQHKIFATDAEHLARSRLVRYEDFAANPRFHLEEIYRWVGLSIDAEALDTISARIDPHTNRKYVDAYCASLRHNPGLVLEHREMSKAFGAVARSAGYDMDGFPCLRGILL